jgi:hypothetical protein
MVRFIHEAICGEKYLSLIIAGIADIDNQPHFPQQAADPSLSLQHFG